MKIKNWSKIKNRKGGWRFTGHPQLKDIKLFIIQNPDGLYEIHITTGKLRGETLETYFISFEQARKKAVKFMQTKDTPAKIENWCEKKEIL